MITVTIEINHTAIAFALDFERHTWTAPQEFPEGYFPIVAHHEDKRYELYSDHTFAQVER